MLTELAEGLQAGSVARDAALAQISGRMAILAFEENGCRVAQLALEHSRSNKEAAGLTKELQGRIREACNSRNANFVLQEAIDRLPLPDLGFMVEELVGSVGRVARNCCGCRVLIRLIVHGGFPQLVDELLKEVKQLSCHKYGHYVIESMLEHVPTCREQVAQELRTNIISAAQHRYGSRIVEKALTYCPEKALTYCPEIADELLGMAPTGILAMGWSKYGCFVLKTLLSTPGTHAETAKAQLRQVLPDLRSSTYAQQVLSELEFL